MSVPRSRAAIGLACTTRKSGSSASSTTPYGATLRASQADTLPGALTAAVGTRTPAAAGMTGATGAGVVAGGVAGPAGGTAPGPDEDEPPAGAAEPAGAAGGASRGRVCLSTLSACRLERAPDDLPLSAETTDSERAVVRVPSQTSRT